jgi:ParB-like chromosome segregation protein Spo0J
MSLAESSLSRQGSAERLEVLAVDEVHEGEGVRSRGLDEAHVAALMETAGEWPPIVIWGDENLILDGAHRVAAARRLGLATVLAARFLGSPDQAYVESVSRNVKHGLPLSMIDRRRAATRVLTKHPDWSNRRIASVCGLSDKTVARMRPARRRDDHRGGVIVDIERKVGKDGKARPTNSRALRDRIELALEENPQASLRAIAAAAGASPETVRSVRARCLEAGSPRGAGSAHRTRAPGTVDAASGPVDRASGGVDRDRAATKGSAAAVIPGCSSWEADQALLTCGDDGEFARWFGRNRIVDEWHAYVWRVPVGRIFDVVDEARRRAASWNSFATLLECRTR